jgi:hypothetical protein
VSGFSRTFVVARRQATVVSGQPSGVVLLPRSKNLEKHALGFL